MDFVYEICQIARTRTQRTACVYIVLPSIELFVALECKVIPLTLGLHQDTMRFKVDTLNTTNVFEIDNIVWERDFVLVDRNGLFL